MPRALNLDKRNYEDILEKCLFSLRLLFWQEIFQNNVKVQKFLEQVDVLSQDFGYLKALQEKSLLFKTMKRGLFTLLWTRLFIANHFS